jgi:putative transcriptional regulator
MRKFDVLCLTPIQETPSLVSKWERGEKHPQGASLKLLSLIEKKGLAVIA